MTNRIKNSILIIYCIIVAAFLVLKISGYSFRNSILNTSLLILVFSYPTIRFFLEPFATWLKLIIVILLLGCVLLVKRAVSSFLAFSNEKKELVQEWKFQQSKIILTKRLGWAGPPYYRYDLIKMKLCNTLEKSIAYGYVSGHKADSCLINFTEGEEYKERFVFDKCKISLYKIDARGR